MTTLFNEPRRRGVTRQTWASMRAVELLVIARRKAQALWNLNTLRHGPEADDLVDDLHRLTGLIIERRAKPEWDPFREVKQ